MHKAKKVGLLAAVLLVIAAIIGGFYYMQSWPLRFTAHLTGSSGKEIGNSSLLKRRPV